MRPIGKKRQQEFVKNAIELITEYGAVIGGRQYNYTMMTKAGVLDIQINDEHSHVFHVPMKFEDPKRAFKWLDEEQLGSGVGNLNKFSGKYNVGY
jgi:hypothetical protein